MPKASGGIESKIATVEGRFGLHVFTETGTLIVHQSILVQYEAYAGGGPGGRIDGGAASGGGGAGGRLTNLNESPLLLEPGEYEIVIGDSGQPGENGGNTEFFGLVAFGGGRGGESLSFNGPENPGADGGCGGGGASRAFLSNVFGGTGFIGQGFDGGSGFNGGATNRWGGGGGGVAGQGQDASSGLEGQGGDGIASGFDGTETVRGRGGRGGRHNQFTRGDSGEPGTGNGGGGARLGEGTPGIGGSGIVMIRYSLPPGLAPIVARIKRLR